MKCKAGIEINKQKRPGLQNCRGPSSAILKSHSSLNLRAAAIPPSDQGELVVRMVKVITLVDARDRLGFLGSNGGVILR